MEYSLIGGVLAVDLWDSSVGDFSVIDPMRFWLGDSLVADFVHFYLASLMVLVALFPSVLVYLL